MSAAMRRANPEGSRRAEAIVGSELIGFSESKVTPDVNGNAPDRLSSQET
jgi:hypothetical protein